MVHRSVTGKPAKSLTLSYSNGRRTPASISPSKLKIGIQKTLRPTRMRRPRTVLRKSETRACAKSCLHHGSFTRYWIGICEGIRRRKRKSDDYGARHGDPRKRREKSGSTG